MRLNTEGEWKIIPFALQKLFSLIKLHLSTLAFVATAFGVLVMKSLPMSMSLMILPMFSSRVFIVLGFTFKSLIYLELTFVYGVRKGTSFNLLHMASQLSQHHLLNGNLFPIACFCQLCQRLDDCRCVVLFLTLCSVPLVYVSVFVLVSCCSGYCSPVV